MKIIGKIYTDFPEKFGIPRQSGLVEELEGKIILEPEYRQPEAFKGLEDYEYIWLLFIFSKALNDNFHATVKPPRLGGNTPMGVFATRSPFRPNNIGMSSVKLERIEYDKALGPILIVKGADILDQTPIIDIKPYLPYTDSHPNAKAGFADTVKNYKLNVTFSDNLGSEKLSLIPENKKSGLLGLLAEDPRPGYSKDDVKEYGIAFCNINIRFIVKDNILTVTDITPQKP